MAWKDLRAKHTALAASPGREGEQIIYKPLGAGPGVQINAAVRRNPRDTDFADMSHTVRDTIEVLIANDPDLGVDAVVEKKDMISIARELGGKPQDHLVNAILNVNSGSWLLELTI